MTAFNTVRFKVKPGREQDFLDAHAAVDRNWAGLRHANIVDTGERHLRDHRRMGRHGQPRRRAAADDRDARQLSATASRAAPTRFRARWCSS